MLFQIPIGHVLIDEPQVGAFITEPNKGSQIFVMNSQKKLDLQLESIS